MSNPDIKTWLEEWATLWGTGDLVGKVHVAPDRRIRRSLGRCHSRSGRIRLHPALFEPENVDVLREVVCHEAAHAAAYVLHGGKVRPHGAEWKQLVTDAGYTPVATMKVSRLSPELLAELQPKVRFRHTCAICGATRMAGRRVKTWRCQVCRRAGLKGRIQVFR